MKEIKRKCQGCSLLLERNNLIKITRLDNGKLKINPKSDELGRSLYVCPKKECIKMLIKKKRIKQALKYSNIEEIKRVENELLNFHGIM